jgi:hypothetical protein
MWRMSFIHGTDWLIFPWQISLYFNDSINIDDPQAPGSHGQILTNHLTEGLCACGPLTALIGSHFLVVPAFPCPLSSQEIDVGIVIRKVEAHGKDNCSTELTHYSRNSFVRCGLCETVPSCTIACIWPYVALC